ncbi:hypothetical protein ACJX0J_005963, partial [Zea mays]
MIIRASLTIQNFKVISILENSDPFLGGGGRGRVRTGSTDEIEWSGWFSFFFAAVNAIILQDDQLLGFALMESLDSENPIEVENGILGKDSLLVLLLLNVETET